MSLAEATVPKETKRHALRRALCQKSLKLQAISAFRTWRDEQLKRIPEEKQRLIDKMLTACPEAVITSLKIRKEFIGRIIDSAPTRCAEIDFYYSSSKELRQFKEVIGTLQKAWSKVVKIKITTQPAVLSVRENLACASFVVL